MGGRVEDVLSDLRGFRPLGELCYVARALGASWGDVEGCRVGGYKAAWKWARDNGRVWPPKLVDGEFENEKGTEL